MQKMKDSGVEWLGKVPAGWEILEQKWLMRKVKRICAKWSGENVLSLTTAGVIIRDVESGKGKFPATFDGYQYIASGNLVLCLFDIDVTPRCLGLAVCDGVISPAYSQYEMLEGANSRYYNYYLRAIDDRKLYLGLTSTLRHSFTPDLFDQIKALRPPLDEQLKIADYLDAECTEIDRAVDAAEKSIEEYKTYRNSVIFQAVTKGVDPDVPMKDSGVEWLGAIPEGWSITPIKHLFYISKTIAGTTGFDVLSITQKGLKVKDIKSGEGQIAADYSNYQIVEPGDFAMNHMDLLTGWIDLAQQTGVTSPDYRVFKARISSLDKRYFLRVFQHYYSARIFYGFCKGVSGKGRFRLPADAFKSIQIPVPPYETQCRIADYLDAKCVGIDKVVEAKQSVVEDLKAYKQSLIYEVVTGKREV